MLLLCRKGFGARRVMIGPLKQREVLEKERRLKTGFADGPRKRVLE